MFSPSRATRQIQGDIFIRFLRKIINELLTESVLPIDENQMILDKVDSDNHQIKFESLNLDGCRFIFIVCGYFLIVTLITFFMEMIISKLLMISNVMYNKQI